MDKIQLLSDAAPLVAQAVFNIFNIPSERLLEEDEVRTAALNLGSTTTTTVW